MPKVKNPSGRVVEVEEGHPCLAKCDDPNIPEWERVVEKAPVIAEPKRGRKAKDSDED